MRELLLLPVCAGAVLCDIYGRKIPNVLTGAGWIAAAAYQWSVKGPLGMKEFAGGIMVPFVLLGVLHYFHMIGAGDIKLLMACGGFFGPVGSLQCVCLSFLIAAAMSLAVLARHHILLRRLKYLFQYLQDYRKSRKWKPYITQGEDAAYLHFSIPVCISVLLMSGGIL
ncbi:MAG: A24 family peptidase [Eubacteriales bacterium]|nr:A24 family peptidase [Eubacteriales bacterium]